jgi:hypothetical protein
MGLRAHHDALVLYQFRWCDSASSETLPLRFLTNFDRDVCCLPHGRCALGGRIGAVLIPHHLSLTARKFKQRHYQNEPMPEVTSEHHCDRGCRLGDPPPTSGLGKKLFDLRCRAWGIEEKSLDLGAAFDAKHGQLFAGLDALCGG